jgi:hypothetical protein
LVSNAVQLILSGIFVLGLQIGPSPPCLMVTYLPR